MKTAVLFFIVLTVFSADGHAWTDDYDENYQTGYQQGYTYSGGGIEPIAPIPPITPIPKIGETDQDAFTRGVLEGREAREERGY